MVDALRYELSCELSLKRKANIQNKPILAVTPTETPVGMGSLFSSGEIEKILKDKRVFIVDKKTGKTLDNVSNREENLKELLPGVEIIQLGSELPETEAGCKDSRHRLYGPRRADGILWRHNDQTLRYGRQTG